MTIPFENSRAGNDFAKCTRLAGTVRLLAMANCIQVSPAVIEKKSCHSRSSNIPRRAVAAANGRLRLCQVLVLISSWFTLAGCSDRATELSQQLSSNEVELRRSAARSLAEMELAASPAIGAIADAATNDADADVRRLCAFALGEIATETDESQVALKQALQDKDAKVRATAAYSIVKLNPHDSTAVPVLIESVKAGDLKAIVVLGQLGPAARDAVDVLTTALQDRRHNLVRMKAAQSLERIGPAAASAVPMLKQLANDRDVDVRHAASQAIAAIER